jgi:co-chaperonin GroES (HSP10)
MDKLFQCLPDFILIEPHLPEDKTSGGVVMIENVKRMLPIKATVLSVGCDVLILKEGDVISTMAGAGLELNINGHDSKLIQSMHVYGIWDNDNFKPFGKLVLIEELKEEELVIGGVIIPEAAKRMMLKKVRAVSVGYEVNGIIDNDIVAYDAQQGVAFNIKDRAYKLVPLQKIFFVLRDSKMKII